MPYVLPETELLNIKRIKKEGFEATFVIEPLLPGYGYTIGHALRRVLLSSLGGAATWSVKIEGTTHEFSTLPGVKEDIVDISLNLKSIRVKLTEGDEAILKLFKKGPGEVRAKDFSKNSQIEIMDPEHYICTLDKNGKIDLELTIKKGLGYVPTEARKEEKLPLGTIALDSNFTPIRKINYEVESTRVGSRTDYDKLVLDIATDGNLEPEEALDTAISILLEHYNLIDVQVKGLLNNKNLKIEKTKKSKSISKQLEIEEADANVSTKKTASKKKK